MSEEALQIAEKRREVKSKGEKERYKHLNAEFQRISRRDKKDFLSDQCKEIGENNRMGKTSDLFKKIKHNKGTCHAKMVTIKDINGMDLTEAEDIKKWQEYTEELYKKDLHDPDNHFALLHFFFLGMVLVTVPAQCYEPPSVVLWALCLPDLIPGIYLSLPVYNHKGFDLGHN